VTTIENECLWRIKDAEELIKSRITQAQVEAQLSLLKSEMTATHKYENRLLNETITNKTQ
jgi:hypothetical protein